MTVSTTNGAVRNRLGKGKTKQDVAIPVYELDIQSMNVPIESLSPLLMHKFSDTQRKAIENKQQKKAKTARELRDPEQEFKDAMYLLPGPAFGEKDCRVGLPGSAFKKAIVSAARFTEAKMTELRGSIFVHSDAGGLIEIDYGSVVMNETRVTVGKGSLDLRYRPEFHDWSATLRVDYNASVLSAEQVINLINTAGFAVGVGDYRPETNGEYGRFRVAA